MRKINQIHVHHTGSNYAQHDNVHTIRKWHVENNGWSDIGYTYFISQGGNLFLGRPIERIPASIRGHNNYAVAIALSGSFEQGRIHPRAGQIETLIDLLRNLLAIFDLKTSNVYAHRELANTLCPGFNIEPVKEVLDGFKTIRT
jgi:hypothetical protein